MPTLFQLELSHRFTFKEAFIFLQLFWAKIFAQDSLLLELPITITKGQQFNSVRM